MKEQPPTTPAPAWLAEWLARATELSPQRSIVIGSRCCTDLKGIGIEIAHYLNEFDENAEGNWHEFSHTDLHHFAGDPACREMILSGAESDPHPGPPDSDLDRVARRVARLGGAVLEGRYSLDATTDLRSAFRVCLCGEHPTCIDPCDIWINSTSFSREGLVAVIADSFLDWANRRGGGPVSTTTPNAQLPANGAEPDSRHCASL
jgi:hypothetical protein